VKFEDCAQFSKISEHLA